MISWVRLSKYCELTGETRNSVRVKIDRGHWLDGRHFKKLPADRKIWINLKAVDEWLENQHSLAE